MHSVYLVDDDPLIIENLTKTVPWMENGFHVVGSSVDPVHAADEIVLLRPDVVFSDLKMPSMDGTHMIKQLKSCGVDCEFVLLSAFGTFEDARSFFLLDGFDYLLKPLRQQDAEIVLERLGRRLAERNCVPLADSFCPSGNANFDQVILYLAKNYHKKITLSDLSKKFGISPNYICNLFAKHYNSTLTIFLTNLRMSEAALQIRTSDRAFKEIALNCGYRDYFYFCKAFKEYYKMTPSQFKEDSITK